MFPVPGVGPKTAKLMIIGEALGKEESEAQEPFQGRAGKLLNKFLTNAKLKRKEIYISNIVHCRPTKNKGRANRPPKDTEIQACKKWIWKEIQEVGPKIIVTLGKIPTFSLLHQKLKKSFKLKDIVGDFFEVDYCSAKIVPLYHPSYLMQHGKKMHGMTAEILTNIGRQKCLK
jgi:DNA polymerase